MLYRLFGVKLPCKTSVLWTDKVTQYINESVKYSGKHHHEM